MATTVLTRESEGVVAFGESSTRSNLLRAFAGESQARNRYTFGAERAEKEGYAVLARIFTFTAAQEKEHAQIFYDRLCKEAGGETIPIRADYPVDDQSDILALLQDAYHHEFTEFQRDYPDFATTAEEEGFLDIANTFRLIAKIEQRHGERFALFANLLDKGQLFRDGEELPWVCLNCGHLHYGDAAPAICPVCSHNQGYFIRKELEPYAR